MDLAVIILAGGKGKRMNSPLPKVLQLVGGVPMIKRIVDTVQKLNPVKIIAVVSPEIQKQIALILPALTLVVQPRSTGTGDAVRWALPEIPIHSTVCILNSDTPLITSETLSEILQAYPGHLQFTALYSSSPTGCGRILLENNKFSRIVEEKDCTVVQKKINLINCGIYVSSKEILERGLPLVEDNNAAREYYITDIGKVALRLGYPVHLHILPPEKEKEMVNVNTLEQLNIINKWSAGITK